MYMYMYMQLASVDRSLKVAAVRKLYSSSGVDEENSHITQFFKVSSYQALMPCNWPLSRLLHCIYVGCVRG